MRKLIAAATALLLALALCAATAAENAAADLYGMLTDLLFRTDNVTLSANVEFSLDGEWFKTAEVLLKQDRQRTFRQLTLRSPKADGTERKNGYTVITDGDDLYLMEVFTPGVYRTGGTSPRTSILRRTVETEQMTALGSALASQADLLLGKGAVAADADGNIRLEMEDGIPGMVNAALNQIASLAARRYFSMDYDRMDMNTQTSLYYFATVTEGLLYSFRSASLWKASAVFSRDADGNLLHAEGSISLGVSTASDGIHELGIRFTADAADRGSTMVRKFNPVEYDVVLAEDSEPSEGVEYGEFPDGGDRMDELQEAALEIWSRTGYNMNDTEAVGGYLQQDRYEIFFDGRDGVKKTAWFAMDGCLLGIDTDSHTWQNVNVEEYDFDTPPDPKADAAAKELMMGFLRDFCPEVLDSVPDLKAEWIHEVNGEVYAQYDEYPLDQDDGGVLFIVRLSPALRIECYSCESNG